MKFPTTGVAVCLISMAVIFASGVAAWQDCFFNVSQMRAKGIRFGGPFIVGGGQWGDFFILSFLLGYICQVYGKSWTTNEWWTAIGIATLVSIGMAKVWCGDKIPGAHAYGGKLSAAGWIHLLYMPGALAIIGLTYMRPPTEAPTRFFIIVSTLVIIHLILGTNILNGKPEWAGKDYLRDKVAWRTLTISSGVVIWRTLVILRHKT